MAKNGMLDRFARFELLGQPVGKAIVWSAGFGAVEALGATMAGLLPLHKQLGFARERSVAKAIIAVIAKTKFVQKFIGASTANVLAVAAWVLIVEEQLQVRVRIGNFVGQIMGMLPIPRSLVGNEVRASASASLDGLGDIDTVIPVEGEYDEFMGLGAADMTLTSLEGKLASIAG